MNRLNGIKKVEKLVWNKEIEQDFMKLKKSFTQGGIQGFLDFQVGDPFILTTDWRARRTSQECCLKCRTDKSNS